MALFLCVLVWLRILYDNSFQIKAHIESGGCGHTRHQQQQRNHDEQRLLPACCHFGLGYQRHDTDLQNVSIGDAYGCSNGETTQSRRGAGEPEQRASINFSVQESCGNQFVATEFAGLFDPSPEQRGSGMKRERQVKQFVNEIEQVIISRHMNKLVTDRGSEEFSVALAQKCLRQNDNRLRESHRYRNGQSLRTHDADPARKYCQVDFTLVNYRRDVVVRVEFERVTFDVSRGLPCLYQSITSIQNKAAVKAKQYK